MDTLQSRAVPVDVSIDPAPSRLRADGLIRAHGEAGGKK